MLTARWPRYRTLLFKLVLSIFVFLIALKACDLAVGWILKTPERHLLRLSPNASVRHREREFDYIYNTNSLGFRGKEIPLDKPPGAQRIVVLGDSLIAGYGVADDEVLTVHLEELLGEPYQVVNAGRTGSSTIRELDVYRSLARRFKPDIVVLAFYLGNDLIEVVDEHDREELRSWRPPGMVKGAAYTCYPNLYLELALWRQAQITMHRTEARSEEELLGALRTEAAQRGVDPETAVGRYRQLPDDVRRDLEAGLLSDQRIFPACYDPQRHVRALEPDDEFFDRAWPRIERHLDLLKQAVEADGARLVIAAIPAAVQVDRETLEFDRRLGFEVRDSWLEGTCRTGRALSAWVEKADVDYIDLAPGLRESAEPLCFPANGRLNPAGHLWTAELLADFLSRLTAT